MNLPTAQNYLQRGFTIVELLIVIVVIAILASLTLVAYNGVTVRANTSSAQGSTVSAQKKAELYNAENNSYPSSSSALTGAASTTSYYLKGVTFNAAALTTSNLPSSPSQINFYKCGTGATTTAPANLAAITTQTGVRFDYWNYSTSAVASTPAGVISGLVGGYNVACYITP